MPWDDIGEEQAKQIFLEEISVFETSPTKYPANRWMSVFQKAETDDLPDSAFLYVVPGGEKDSGKTKPRSFRRFPYRTAAGEIDQAGLVNAVARIPQADLPAETKTSLQERARKLLEQLKPMEKSMTFKQRVEARLAKSSLDDKARAEFMKAMAFEGKETGEEEDEEEPEKEKKEKAKCKKAADDATVALEQVKSLVQKSVAALDIAEPQPKAALDILSPIVGHKPVHQILAAMPAEARLQFEALQKSADDTKRQLEELQKSQAVAARKDRVRELVQKSQATLAHVPLSAGDIGEMIADVQDASPKAAASLERMLATVEGVMAKSNILGREFGTSATKDASGSTAEAEIDKLAGALIQKSAADGKRMNKALAWNAIVELHPELGKRYDLEKSARAGNVGLGEG